MRTAVRFACAFCLLAIAASLSLAQSTNSGDIRGTVTDSSGAVIAGASVVLTNIDTGESQEFTTNEKVIYDTVSTRPGNYNLTFTKAGFKKVTQGPVVLRVSIITVDASLGVGEVSQTVHVEVTGAPLLETETGQQGTILDEKTINELPQLVAGITGNEWGGSVGGPIIKNKLFFFFVRDKITNVGSGNPHTSTVPTLAERGMGTANPGQYDFSGQPTIYDPTTAGIGGTRTAFANNIIPANRIDPMALKHLSFYPSPTTGAPWATTNNLFSLSPSSNPNLRYFGRIDYDLMKNNRVTFSITNKNNPGKNLNQWACPLNCFSGDIDGYNVQLSDVWTLSPTIVNEFRMGYTKQGNWFVPQSLGFDAASTLGLQYSKANIFPTFNLSGTCCSSLQPGTNAIYIEHLYDPSDVMTLIKGRHILHFGVEVLMGDGNTTPWGNVDAGQFTFTGNYTANGPLTGAGLADFLLGDVQAWKA